MAQALVEANFNVDPEEDENIPISGDAARQVFIADLRKEQYGCTLLEWL